jgi:hypothetical protein
MSRFEEVQSMSNAPVERRADVRPTDTRDDAMAAIVLEALVIQRREGNVGAIEYMERNNVPANVIERIASGCMRLDDAFMLAALANEASE